MEEGEFFILRFFEGFEELDAEFVEPRVWEGVRGLSLRDEVFCDGEEDGDVDGEEEGDGRAVSVHVDAKCSEV